MEEKGQIFLKIRCIRALPEPGGTPGSVTAPVRSLETEWQHRGGETGVGGGAGASATISHVVTSNRPAPRASVQAQENIRPTRPKGMSTKHLAAAGNPGSRENRADRLEAPRELAGCGAASRQKRGKLVTCK